MRALVPTHFLVAVLSSGLNRQQQAVIEYLLEEKACFEKDRMDGKIARLLPNVKDEPRPARARLVPEDDLD